MYKCRVCGENDFIVFTAFNGHRKKAHRHIPITKDGDNEKSFACGICGKPWYLREDAIICSELRHKPDSLLQDLFRYKCLECGDKEWGFRNFTLLRQHWAVAHVDKLLPPMLRKGMYNKRHKVDKLPKVRIDKTMLQKWKGEGIPTEVMELKRETPLFVKLPLFEIPEEKRFF